MEKANNSISTYYLRTLLADLGMQKAEIGFRFRMLGEMWRPNFMRVVKLTDRGAIFMDESTEEFVFISDLADIVQIEIEDRFQDLQPHFHYEVTPN
jgi:hypothetical protein